jgi:hypothetical protein
MKYGALGDGVNLAARLKGLNSRYRTKCLASEATIAHAAKTRAENRGKDDEEFMIVRPVDLVVVKGKTVPIKVHELLGPRWKHSCMLDLEEVGEKHRVSFEHYLNRRFSEALEELREVNTVMEASSGLADEPSRMLMERCLAYALDPPAADWDGAERCTQKMWAPPAKERGDSMVELPNTANLASRDTSDGIMPSATGEDLRAAAHGTHPPAELLPEPPSIALEPPPAGFPDLPNTCSVIEFCD